MFKIVSNPTIVTNDEIWLVILDILRRFNYLEENTNQNGLWGIFMDNQSIDIIPKLTGVMLRRSAPNLSEKMVASAGLNLENYSPSASMDLLVNVLSWIWVPVVTQFPKPVEVSMKKMGILNRISKEVFIEIKDSEITVNRKMSKFKVWSIKEQYKVWAMGALSGDDVTPYGKLPENWEKFKTFVSKLATIAYGKFGPELLITE